MLNLDTPETELVEAVEAAMQYKHIPEFDNLLKKIVSYMSAVSESLNTDLHKQILIEKNKNKRSMLALKLQEANAKHADLEAFNQSKQFYEDLYKRFPQMKKYEQELKQTKQPFK